ncbi:MAG: hypothetical protein EBS96_14900 [Spartobacteria bacterium]|jgi:hypothetical protein|nr:hypothetical protein [Spartobacteria bacterium]
MVRSSSRILTVSLQGQSIALDGGRFVCPLSGEALQKLIAKISWKPLVKKTSLRALRRTVFKKGKNRVVAHIQPMPAIDLLRRGTKTTARGEESPQLGFVRL